MRYVGSKRTIAADLLPRILAGRRTNQFYVEPFVGGCNMIDKVKGLRMGNDIDPLLIAMWKALQNGWIPPRNISEYEYYEVKNNQSSYPPELVCFVGNVCSFGGKRWGGYAWCNGNINYAQRGHNVLLNQIAKLKDVQFTCLDYRKLQIPSHSIIYCDPPYKGTLGYNKMFNHSSFWNWCRKMTILGHKVYVSEYKAPVDFVCVRELYRTIILDRNRKQPIIERLFMYNREYWNNK